MWQLLIGYIKIVFLSALSISGHTHVWKYTCTMEAKACRGGVEKVCSWPSFEMVFIFKSNMCLSISLYIHIYIHNIIIYIYSIYIDVNYFWEYIYMINYLYCIYIYISYNVYAHHSVVVVADNKNYASTIFVQLFFADGCASAGLLSAFWAWGKPVSRVLLAAQINSSVESVGSESTPKKISKRCDYRCCFPIQL